MELRQIIIQEGSTIVMEEGIWGIVAEEENKRLSIQGQ
jgi:hypothetical protein